MSDLRLEDALRWVDTHCYDEAVTQQLRHRKVARTLADEIERLRAAVQFMDLAPVITWLENGCNVSDAIHELRLMQQARTAVIQTRGPEKPL